MLRMLKERFTIQGYRTFSWPKGSLEMSDRFRGSPVLDTAKVSREQAVRLVDSCPFAALQYTQQELVLDLGRCLFCADCPASSFISFGNDYRMAASKRGDLLLTPGRKQKLASVLPADLHKLFGRSLKFRQVSAGGCNACEADSNVLSTIGWDMGRFGIQFVASPRHADGIWVTGPVSKNMQEALLKTWEAVPAPKIVVACGACAINGGPFAGSPELGCTLDSLLPVDLYVPGCPPHPATILDGLLRLQGRI